MSSIDDPARRLGLDGRTPGRSLLADLARNWNRPSLSLVLLLAGLQNYAKRLLSLFQSGGGGGAVSSLLPGFGPSTATEASGSTGPLFAVGAWFSLTILSFIGSKIFSIYNYFNPLNFVFRQAYIDSRFTTQVEAHKWLTCILEASPKYKKSRDLDASNFQSVRERQNSDDGGGRYDRWGDSHGRQATKVLEVIQDPARAAYEVPVFFQPRDIDEFWFFKFGTLFRVIKRAPRNVRRPAIGGFNDDYDDYGQSEPAILVRCFSRTRKPLMQFLAYARDEYFKGFKENLYCQVYTFDDYQWNASAMKMGRGFDTIIIPEETKQKLLDDVEEFLNSQDWYSSRGIPWKRGIMFSGPPGNGKSSTIQALAATYDLPIYILPLNSTGFSDSTLSRAVSRLSSRCILVIEDLDALNLKNSHRTSAAAGSGGLTDLPLLGKSTITSWLDTERVVLRSLRGRGRGRGRGGRFMASRTGLPARQRLLRFAGSGGTDQGDITNPGYREERLSLSAVLNVLDGIDSGEGRIVIASTNHLDFLQFDEALLRPGRFDFFVQFKKATKSQAKNLFLQFYKDYRSKVELLEKEFAPDEEFTERLRLGAEEVNVLADEFQGMVENEEFSVAALQGHLIAYKTNPYLAVREMPRFVSELRKAKDPSGLDDEEYGDESIGEEEDDSGEPARRARSASV